MIKIYELIKQNSGRLVFNYCGVTLNVNFENGNTVKKVNASFRTNNRFFQDAIEKDNRFGVSIRLAKSFLEPSDAQQTTADAETSAPAPAEADPVVEKKTTTKSTKKKSTKESTPAEEEKQAIAFDTVNDFMQFLEDAGETLENPDDLEAYKKKYNATIKE